MSALLDRPEVKGKQSLPKPQIARKSSAKPNLHLNARIVQKKKRPSYGPVIAAKCALLAGLLGLTFMASSFSGHVLLEGARQERIEAKKRAQEAKQAEEILVAKLRVISSAGGIDEWAVAHNFVAPEKQLEEKNASTRGLVARR